MPQLLEKDNTPTTSCTRVISDRCQTCPQMIPICLLCEAAYTCTNIDANEIAQSVPIGDQLCFFESCVLIDYEWILNHSVFRFLLGCCVAVANLPCEHPRLHHFRKIILLRAIRLKSMGPYCFKWARVISYCRCPATTKKWSS